MSLHSSITGYDFTGRIISSPHFASGTKVLGMTWPAPFRPLHAGAHQSSIIHEDKELLLPKPGDMAEETAAGMFSALLTAADGIVNGLGYALPAAGVDGKKPEGGNRGILIWGGASAVGWAAVQVAREVGIKHIFAVCSERNFEAVKSVGATEVFDYRLGGDVVSQQIRQKTKELGVELSEVFDCVGAGLGIFEPEDASAAKKWEESSPAIAKRSLLPHVLEGGNLKGKLWCVLPVTQDDDWQFVLFSRKWPGGEALEERPGWWERQRKVVSWFVENHKKVWKPLPKIRVVNEAEEAVKAIHDVFEGKLSMEKVLIRHPML
ncbi:GroES-like protein [Cladorrhinum sp. PSN259]|nr:GroES-like protein [Cladorrhinum sp. PSN259]